MEAEPPTRKRRRFQFRLRTLSIGVTLVAIPCAYVGRQAKIVRERKEYAERLANFPQVVLLIDSVMDNSGRLIQPFDAMDANRFETYRPNWLRVWLGDRPVQVIDFLSGKPNEIDHQLVSRLFPEATVAVNAIPVADWLHEPR